MAATTDPWLVAADLFDPPPSPYATDPVGFVRDELGFSPWSKQVQILEAIRDHPRVAVRACHGVGKCLHEDERLPLADGRVLRVGDLVGLRAGILAWSEDGSQRPALARFLDNGPCEVFRLTTRCGRTIVRTAEHPLWAATRRTSTHRRGADIRGWVPVSRLDDGDLVLVPDELRTSGMRPLPDHEVRLLGFLLGDGGTTAGVRFTQADGPALDDFRDAAIHLGCRLTERPSRGCTDVNVVSPETDGAPWGRENPALALTRLHGLHGCKAVHKRLPDAAWTLPNEQLGLLLNRLWACDGWAYHRPQASKGSKFGQAQLGISLASEGLIRDVELALLRLGIYGRVRRRSIKLDGQTFAAWEWATTRPADILRFAERVGILGKEAALEKAAAWATGVIARGKTSKWQHEDCPDGYHWAVVSTVDSEGISPTVSVEVPGAHTFLSTFVEHNTAVAARAVIWFLAAHVGTVRVITTAPTWTQVADLLWREVRSAVGTAHDTGRLTLFPEPQVTKLELDAQRFAVGHSTDRADRFQGHHADHLLLVVDEASGVDERIFEAAEGFLTAEGAHVLLVGNPTRVGGQFHRAFTTERALWKQIHVSAYDSPNLTGEPVPKPVARALVTPEWVQERRTVWGEGSPMFQVRVLGEFPDNVSDGVVSLTAVEAAQARALPADPARQRVTIACDVARYGDDETVIAIRIGDRVRIAETYVGKPTTHTAGRLVQLARTFPEPHVRIVVDDAGVGGGVTDLVREDGWRVTAFNGAQRPFDPDGYPNRRSELWFDLAEQLDDLDLDPDEQLAADLTSPTYQVNSKGQRVVEAKADTKKRLGRSPDRGDAVLLTLVPATPTPTVAATAGPEALTGDLLTKEW